MKASDNERLALRVGAAGAALHAAIVECFGLLGGDRPDTPDAGAARLAAARGILVARVVAYAQVLRESGIRERDIAPSVHRAVMLSAPPDTDEGREAATSRVLRWTADALGT